MTKNPKLAIIKLIKKSPEGLLKKAEFFLSPPLLAGEDARRAGEVENKIIFLPSPLTPLPQAGEVDRTDKFNTQNMNKISQFFKEAKAELMKVNWPTRKQAINYTLIVIGISLAVAFFLGSLDYLFSYILKTYILR